MELTTIERSDNVTFIKLSGALDLEGVLHNETRFLDLTDGQGQPAIVDMADVDFLSSLGIRMLVLSAKNLEKRGVKLVLLNPRPLIASTLELAGIDKVIPIVRSEEEALAVLRAG